MRKEQSQSNVPRAEDQRIGLLPLAEIQNQTNSEGAWVDQIRIDTYDDITFTVKPYIVGSDGKKLYSSIYTVTYNDGILVG